MKFYYFINFYIPTQGFKEEIANKLMRLEYIFIKPVMCAVRSAVTKNQDKMVLLASNTNCDLRAISGKSINVENLNFSYCVQILQ